MQKYVGDILNTISEVMKLPVMIILILFIMAVIFMIGWLIQEYITEHRHMKVKLPQLMDQIRHGEDTIENCIIKSGLLRSQKLALIEVTRHKGFTNIMRESLADSLIEDEQAKYNRHLKVSNLLAKLGPIFGLLGTLIPLGPGIIALGQGDTYTLSASLLTAFDTTIAGLLVSAAAIVITTIRTSWYNHYMSVMETVMDCILEMEKTNE